MKVVITLEDILLIISLIIVITPFIILKIISLFKKKDDKVKEWN